MFALALDPFLWSMDGGELSVVHTMSTGLKSSLPVTRATTVWDPLTFSAWPMGCGAGEMSGLTVRVRDSYYLNLGLSSIREMLSSFISIS